MEKTYIIRWKKMMMEPRVNICEVEQTTPQKPTGKQNDQR
jgi:hypothetical protein